MNLGTEALLAALIVVLYLSDCVRLLEPDEALLMSRDGRRWTAGFGARQWRLAGKEPFLANPFRPDQAVFRLRWRVVAQAGASNDTIAFATALSRLGWFAWPTWIVLFVLASIALLGHLGPAVTLPVAGLMYASVLASLAAVWSWRGLLGVTGPAFAQLAFECLVCPPHAANIVRKVAALRPASGDFEQAAARLLEPAAMAQVRAQLLARVDEQIERAGDDAADARPLAEARRRFTS